MFPGLQPVCGLWNLTKLQLNQLATRKQILAKNILMIKEECEECVRSQWWFLFTTAISSCWQEGITHAQKRALSFFRWPAGSSAGIKSHKDLCLVLWFTVTLTQKRKLQDNCNSLQIRESINYWKLWQITEILKKKSC